MAIDFTRKYEVSDKIEDIVERYKFELDEDDVYIYYVKIFDATEELNDVIDPKGRLRDKYDFDGYCIAFRAEVGRGFNGEVCIELTKNDDFVRENGNTIMLDMDISDFYDTF